MLTLYDAARCPYCARVRIVLAEKELEHEIVAIDLDARPEWIVEMNPPRGKVPVLDEDGVVLPESVVLMEYLEGTLSGADRDAIEEHVRGCPRCRAFVESYERTPAILRAATAAALPEDLRESLRRFLASKR